METSRKSLAFKMSEDTGIDLCKVLGLAINNISVYGIAHSVTATSVSSAYDRLVELLDTYGKVSFVFGDSGLLINDTLIRTERSTGQLFVSQLTKLGVNDFTFKSPLDRREFNSFFTILAAAPASEVVADGFEAAVAKGGFKSIQVTNVIYARIDKNADLKKMNFDGPGQGAIDRTNKSSGGANTFDLDMDLGFEDLGFEIPQTDSGYAQTGLNGGSNDNAQSVTVNNKSVNEMHQNLIDTIQETKQQATTLVGKVDSDRKTIAKVEQDAKAHGIGLNLTREELLENLAEINQELSQSLTVVTSVTELLSAENMGSMNQAQRDILKVAVDGIERINKLVVYLGNLSGVPSGFIPDQNIINEAYGK